MNKKVTVVVDDECECENCVESEVGTEFEKSANLVSRLEKHLVDMNDDRGSVIAQGHSWLAEQYSIAIDQCKELIKFEHEKFGRMAVNAARENGVI